MATNARTVWAACELCLADARTEPGTQRTDRSAWRRLCALQLGGSEFGDLKAQQARLASHREGVRPPCRRHAAATDTSPTGASGETNHNDENGPSPAARPTVTPAGVVMPPSHRTVSEGGGPAAALGGASRTRWPRSHHVAACGSAATDGGAPARSAPCEYVATAALCVSPVGRCRSSRRRRRPCRRGSGTRSCRAPCGYRRAADYTPKGPRFSKARYQDRAEGRYTWNRIGIAVDAEALAWLREWPESVISPDDGLLSRE